ncbi:hypothetical protein NE235_10725 [Actinoallomurus spadix]|uniref:Uncharacterized protein n=1 Tax=Actinoallomurus spadix TaxID=79912 RepID=A0ABN0WVY5_9ACTN|nr:hypothetical protein [Actinoallomurus spadix]MCO5986576.1 hypothetical protein [Actinoallomurus spadix]
MANRRDLTIGIDGDPRGLDRAFGDATAKARTFDRELERLERQQAAQERASSRAAEAVRKLGTEEEKAALQARKMGSQVEAASDRAERAQKRAEAAAKAYERGLISEAAAAAAAARAAKALEQAEIRAAEAQLAGREAAERIARAHREAHRAAQEQAEQERQLARDAVLASAAQRLASLKAAGAVKEHNAVIQSLRGTFGDVEKIGGTAFREIEQVTTKATSAVDDFTKNISVLGKSGPAVLGPLAVAIQLLPTLATAAGGAMALGLGGALSLIAIKAQAGNADVRNAFGDTANYINRQFQHISAPFHDVLLHMAKDAETAFDGLSPALEGAFSDMAPSIDDFAAKLAVGLQELDPAISSIGRAFSQTLDDLGPEMGTILHNISAGVESIMNGVAANPGALTKFVVFFSDLVRYAGAAIGFMIRFADVFNTIFKIANMFVFGPLGMLIGGFHDIAKAFGSGGDEATDFAGNVRTAGQAASEARGGTSALAKDMQVLEDRTTGADAKVSALTERFQKLLDPQLAVFEDTAKLRDGFNALEKALKKSHGALDNHNQAARDAKGALGDQVTSLKAYANDLLSSGANIEKVRKKLRPYIEDLYKSAGANKQARSLVDGFVKALGLVPPKKGTKVSVAGATKAKSELQGISDEAMKTEKYSNLKFVLHALDKATGVARKVGGVLKSFARNNYRAVLTAKSAVSGAVSAATGACRTFARGNYRALLTAKNAVTSAFNAVMSLGRRWASQTFNATFGVIKKLFSAEGGYVGPEALGYATGGPVQRFPTGGSVSGPGTATSDSIPAMLSNGEFVVNAAQTARFLPLLEAINSGLAPGPSTATFVASAPASSAAPPATATAAGVAASSNPLDLGGILQQWQDVVKPATKSDVNKAIKDRRTQVDQLRNAEDALARARKRHDPRAVAAAERRVRKEREDLADATKKLKDVEARYNYAKMTPAQQLGAALGMSIRDNAAFLRNLQTLADRGFGQLAQQLLAMGGPEAQKIAASAVKLSNSKLSGLQKQVGQAQQQQDTLSHLNDILSVRSAIKNTKGGISTWTALLNATGLDPASLAAAVKLIAGDLGKTASGKALLADMHAHGYAKGGPIVGPAGIDRVPMWGTAGEYVVNAKQTAAYRPLLDAINAGAVRVPVASSIPVRGGDGARAGATIHQTFATQEMNAQQLAREAAREAAWQLRG